MDTYYNRFQLPSSKDFYSISDGTWAEQEARTLITLSDKTNDKPLSMVSIGEGIGHTSWCLIKAGVAGQVTCLNTNASQFLEDAKKDKKRFRSIFVDLPWFGDMYTQNMNKIADFNPDLEGLVERAVDITSVAAFRLPNKFQLKGVRELSERLGRSAQVYAYAVEGDAPELAVKTVFLGGNGGDFSVFENTWRWIKPPHAWEVV